MDFSVIVALSGAIFMTQPTGGSGSTPPPEPIKPASSPKPLSPSDSKDAFLLQSPFAKMFERTGQMPTVKEIRAIINGILKQQISEIKRSDEQWKKSMERMKRVIEGDE